MKRFTFMIIAFFCLYSMGFAQIKVGTNFSILTNLPIDTRMTAADTITRNAISPMYRYEGMCVYVTNTATNYQLTGGITNYHWKPMLTGAKPKNADTSDIVYMYNKSGITIPRYMVVMVDPNNDNSIAIAPANCELPIGITCEDIPNNSWGYIVVGGIATVNINRNVTRSWYAYVSSRVDGKAVASNNVSSSYHYREIGHFLESRTKAQGRARVMVHFN